MSDYIPHNEYDLPMLPRDFSIGLSSKGEFKHMNLGDTYPSLTHTQELENLRCGLKVDGLPRGRFNIYTPYKPGYWALYLYALTVEERSDLDSLLDGE